MAHPIPTGPGEPPSDRPTGASRLLFVDNLRWVAISMVVVMHAAVTYSPFGSWYFRDRAGTGRVAAILFGTYQSFQHAVSMGLLFGIAGYFAAASLDRKGPAGFLRERAMRLGIPLVAYTALIGPLTIYYVAGNWHARPPRSFGEEWLRHLVSGELLSESGPLWFCLVLLCFSLAFAAWSRLRPAGAPHVEQPLPGVAAILGFVAAMACVTFAVGLLVPAGRTMLNVELHDLPQYPLMFTAGIMARRGGWPLRLSSAAGRAWLAAGLAGGLAAWIAIIGIGGALTGRLADYGGGLHWQAAAMDAWRSFVCVSLSLGLVTLFRDRFDRQGPAARFLARNAFGVYVFHPPILIGVTRLLQGWPAEVWLKFAIASLVGITATFLFVGLVARRTPLLRTIV